MRHYTHLSYEERVVIRLRRKDGASIRKISKELCRAPSTVSRELSRNEQFEGTRVIYPEYAQMKANGRRRRAYRKPRLKSKKLQKYVESKLKAGWSPEQIAGRMKHEHWEERVSHEAIYQYIYKDRRDLRKFLARNHRRRKKRGHPTRRSKGSKIKQRVPISERPAEVDGREEFGHWESDIAVSRGGSTALQVTVERKSRLTKLARLDERNSKAASSMLVRRLSRVPQGARMSITYDNGLENAKHMEVNKKLKTSSYFCEPYQAWQRGTG